MAMAVGEAGPESRKETACEHRAGCIAGLGVRFPKALLASVVFTGALSSCHSRRKSEKKAPCDGHVAS